MTTGSTLPAVWLKSHAYQNVTAIVVTRPATRTDGTKQPSSMKKGGKKRRVAGSLQPRDGNPIPTRVLAQRPISGVDQAHTIEAGAPSTGDVCFLQNVPPHRG